MTSPEVVDSKAKPSARQGDPCVMVIFGASGDLTKRMLIPSLYNLAQGNLIPKEFAVVGMAVDQMTTEGFRETAGRDLREFGSAPFQPELWSDLVSRFYYLVGDFRDPPSYQRLGQLLAQVDKEHGTAGNYLFYLATAPSFFAEIVKQLGVAGLTGGDGGPWRRVVIEKPFGHDLDSARALNRDIRKTLDETQVYRIDHYLGKETVQNIMAFRFSNGIFEPIWNRRYIDHVQITVAETIGVERRGPYYEEAGALRDMVPNHIFQLISLVAMEPPISFDAEAVRDEKAKVLHALQPMTPEQVLSRAVRGQYGEGEIEGNRVPKYRSEPRVSSDSNIETFAALKLAIDNWRWADVPFYLRTGKRMAKRATEITIEFKCAPFLLFRNTQVGSLEPNLLVIRIQPDEAISLRFAAKVPGPVMKLGAVDMNFRYSEYFGTGPSTGYETLLHDCMIGDATLFQRADMAEAGWSIVTPILDVWKAMPPRNFPNYAAGTWGPKEAGELIERDGRRWRESDQ